MFQKKSLGQNFLRNAHYLALIADTAELKLGETVLEIGPGEGALTKELLARGAKVIAIEKDRRLIPILSETFAEEIKNGTLTLIEGDVLEEPIELPERFVVVANIPYYITGVLLRQLLSQKNLPERMVLLMQKEVAERIARSKKESIISLSIKAYGDPVYIKTVPRGAFAPMPGVDSAILSVRNISRNHFKNASEERFFEIVKAGFAQKRKLLARNVEAIFENPAAALATAGIAPSARAEDVSLSQWLTLAETK